MNSRLIPPEFRLSVDVGGTFTDTVLMDEAGSIVASNKMLTTHTRPAEAAITGVRRALTDVGGAIEQVSGFIHGTTLATNALIERRGATVATVTTEGFRDILEIAYERRYSQYDINLEKTDFLVPRNRSFTIKERMANNGEVLIDLCEVGVSQLIHSLQHSGVDAVAICLLHSYANNKHEKRLRSLLLDAMPELVVSISSEVSPEAREFDRLCTTVANAYIQPLMAQYLTDFKRRFQEMGLASPILMMTASGGMTTIDTASRFPIRLVESGPAGGAILAAKIARECALDEVLSFDMGGTTAKLCLIDKAKPQKSREFEIARAARFIKGSGIPVRIPVVEMIEIGAGGGSIASVDRLGRLTVGPESAGSEPGPVAFQRGGLKPTVTDADVVLGYIQPESFSEQQFQIDVQAASIAVESQIGKTLSLDARRAADGISRIVDESMASAARMHAVESGKDLSSRTMIAFGGNGPLHACRVARSAGVSTVLIPNNPSVGSAVGFLFAPISFETVRSQYQVLSSLDFTAINGLLKAMRTEAESVVRQGIATDAWEVVRTAFMRYSGQGHEIEIVLPESDLSLTDVPGLTTAFEAAYKTQFSRPVPNMEIEILNWSVCVSSLSQPLDPESLHTQPDASRTRGQTIPVERSADIHCEVSDTVARATVVQRSALQVGDSLPGPMLITEPQTTTYVASDFTVCVDQYENLILSHNVSEPA